MSLLNPHTQIHVEHSLRIAFLVGFNERVNIRKIQKDSRGDYLRHPLPNTHGNSGGDDSSAQKAASSSRFKQKGKWDGGRSLSEPRVGLTCSHKTGKIYDLLLLLEKICLGAPSSDVRRANMTHLIVVTMSQAESLELP